MDINDIKKYETMIKLSFIDEERQWAIDAANILEDSFKALEEVDTEGVDPLVYVLDMENIMREDISQKNLSKEELLKNAPEQYDGYFQAPKTLE